MPKKLPGPTPEQQRAIFEAEVQRMVDAGEIDPAEAEARFDRALEKIVRPKDAPS